MRVSTIASLTTHLIFGSGCLLDIERQGGHVMDRHPNLHRRLVLNGSIPIGVGDRFSNTSSVPLGIGFHPTADISTVYNVAEIDSASQSLCREFHLPCFTTPFLTHENRSISGFQLGGNPPTVLITAGIHARERGGPDHLLNFASDLLHAARANTGLVYGGTSYTLSDILTALSVGIIVLPNLNPDGLAHDQATHACWRKNRNPASADASDPHSVGVDLNRNFAPVWNFTEYFVAKGPRPASDQPSAEDFHGTGPLSEPETRNVDWVMDRHPELGWFMDVHSTAAIVVHGWFHESNQCSDPGMNLLDPQYRGMMGAVPDAGPGTRYREFLEVGDWDAMSITAARVAGGMTDAMGKTYLGLPAANYAPSSGTSGDHGMWRALVGGGKKVRGFGMEFGQSNRAEQCTFYPTVERHRASMVETGAGFMEFLLSAARLA